MKPAHLLSASVIAVAGVASLFAVLAPTGSRQASAVLSQLERPAAAQSTQATTTIFLVRRRTYTLRVALSPNLAGHPDHLVVKVMRGGRPVSGARMRVVFSMPAMNMWAAFTSLLEPRARGVYVRQEPVLGMAGLWQLRFEVTRDGAHFSAVVNDRMRG